MRKRSRFSSQCRPSPNVIATTAKAKATNGAAVAWPETSSSSTKNTGGGGEAGGAGGGGGGAHLAETSVPREHEVTPINKNPGSHVGTHVVRLASALVQSPTPPFLGGADASQVASATHVAAVYAPPSQ